MDAAKSMVDLKGGNDKLGLNGFLGALVDTLTCAVALRNPIGESPHPQFGKLPNLNIIQTANAERDTASKESILKVPAL